MPAEAFAGAGRWRCVSAEMLVRAWDDDAVVFNGSTCTTHLVTPSAAAVLQAMGGCASALDARQIWQLAFGDEPGHDELQMFIEGSVRVS